MPEPAPPLREYVTGLVRRNLGQWSIPYYLFFFVGIPLVNILVWLVPEQIKSAYFVFHTTRPFWFPAYILSGYTHLELYPHLAGNLLLYLLSVFVIFSFESNRARFRMIAVVALIGVPVIVSLVTAVFWRIVLGGATDSLGFSGVVAAFLAYAFLAFLTGFLGPLLGMFDHRELFRDRMGIFYFSCALLSIAIALVVVCGEILGQFFFTGTSVSNGLAHFAGYNAGLIAFLAIDLFSEKRRYFDAIGAMSIIVCLVYYFLYLESLLPG